MNVLVTGGTGFVGGRLVELLYARGDHVTIVTRTPKAPREARDGVVYAPWLPDVSKFDAIVHLAGEPVVGKRWSARQKSLLWSSRVDSTREIVEAIAKSTQRPKVFVCASAVGYYGDRGDEVLLEDSKPAETFLARLCVAWEADAAEAERHGVRVASIRIGLVLGRDAGALKRMLPVFKLGLGGPFGTGSAWFPWIHVDDLCALLLFAIDDERARGAFNAAAPGIVQNREFAKTLGRVVSRPAFFSVPSLLLRIALGEAASVLTASQRCVPARARELGFEFTYPDLEPALRDVVLARH
jgi:uncharacterized protein (TIGR01777 family)